MATLRRHLRNLIVRYVTREVVEWLLLRWADSSETKLTTTKAKNIIKTLRECEVK